MKQHRDNRDTLYEICDWIVLILVIVVVFVIPPLLIVRAIFW